MPWTLRVLVGVDVPMPRLPLTFNPPVMVDDAELTKIPLRNPIVVPVALP